MNAGRELDALVAEKVMGWKRIDSISWSEPLPSGLGHQRMIYEIPEYSTSIADAWEVVEKLLEINVQLELSNFPAGQWCAKLLGIEAGSQRVGFAISSFAPHAICLAALKAVGAL